MPPPEYDPTEEDGDYEPYPCGLETTPPEYDPPEDADATSTVPIQPAAADACGAADGRESKPGQLDPDVVEGRILKTITAAGKPLTVAELSEATSIPAEEISYVAYWRIWSGKLKFIAGEPCRYGLPGMADPCPEMPIEDRVASLLRACW